MSNPLRMLVCRGAQTKYLGVAGYEAKPGDRFTLPEAHEEALLLVFEGELTVQHRDRRLGILGGRSDVFTELATAGYQPANCELALTARTASTWVRVSAPAEPDGTDPYLIPPEQQMLRDVGKDNWRRTIRTVLGEQQHAQRLIVGETINPAGNWSSYPPHKHDRDDYPSETALEEVYFYRVKPANGFGIQIRYDGDAEEAQIVRDGSIQVLKSGYHPVVAAPGYELYYLWMLAGERRALRQRFDPEHEWLNVR